MLFDPGLQENWVKESAAAPPALWTPIVALAPPSAPYVDDWVG